MNLGSSRAYDGGLRRGADGVDDQDRFAYSFRAPSLGFEAS